MRARGLAREAQDTYAGGAHRVLVAYVEKLSVAHLREHVAHATGMTGLVFVTTVVPGAVMRQAIAECCGVIQVEVFAHADLVYDVMAHELVPTFEVLSDAEKRELLAKYKMRTTQLPRLLSKDPCARYLNLQRGVVVRIVRRPADAEAYATYRIVV